MEIWHISLGILKIVGYAKCQNYFCRDLNDLLIHLNYDVDCVIKFVFTKLYISKIRHEKYWGEHFKSIKANRTVTRTQK